MRSAMAAVPALGLRAGSSAETTMWRGALLVRWWTTGLCTPGRKRGRRCALRGWTEHNLVAAVACKCAITLCARTHHCKPGSSHLWPQAPCKPLSLPQMLCTSNSNHTKVINASTLLWCGMCGVAHLCRESIELA